MKDIFICIETIGMFKCYVSVVSQCSAADCGNRLLDLLLACQVGCGEQ